MQRLIKGMIAAGALTVALALPAGAGATNAMGVRGRRPAGRLRVCGGRSTPRDRDRQQQGRCRVPEVRRGVLRPVAPPGATGTPSK